jgi:hypothetical protein
MANPSGNYCSTCDYWDAADSADAEPRSGRCHAHPQMTLTTQGHAAWPVTAATVRAFREHSTCGAAIMNLHATLPLDEAPIAADPITRMLHAAKLSSEGELLDAVEARRVELGLSLATLDQLAGLALGHSSKCLSPARAKRPTTGTLYAMLDALALSACCWSTGPRPHASRRHGGSATK